MYFEIWEVSRSLNNPLKKKVCFFNGERVLKYKHRIVIRPHPPKNTMKIICEIVVAVEYNWGE